VLQLAVNPYLELALASIVAATQWARMALGPLDHLLRLTVWALVWVVQHILKR